MNLADNPAIRSLIDIQEHPFVLIDSHHQIVAANRAYCRTYGFESDRQLVGRPCYAVSHHVDQPCYVFGEDCPHRQVLQHQQEHTVLHTHYDCSGQPEHVRIRGHPIPGPDGQPLLGEAIHRLATQEDMDCDEMRMIGRSRPLLRAVEQLTQVANGELGVLLLGESGVGKELAARYVHRRSPRQAHPFQVVDCTTLTHDLFESEIFGHEPGAFTGSAGRKQGLFELADGGTLFLDEVGELPLTMQAKLLRALETGEFRRVGGERSLQADVRVVTATNRDLQQMVAEGRFREDLYYRLACVTIQLPALRERRDDIPALAEALLARINQASGRSCVLADDALEALQGYDFPGNVRELRNILQRAAALCRGGIIGAEELGLGRGTDPAGAPPCPGAQPAPEPGNGELPSMEALEERYMRELLARFDGRRRPVAEAMGVSERTLYRKLKRYGLT
jgi:DNA-binding NtrC family response regulator